MPIDPSRAMDRIETRLRQLQIEFRRFFSGALEVPPVDLTESLQADFRTLRASGRLTVADSFRLGALEARFTSHSQLHQRRLQAQEIQVSSRSRGRSAPPAAASGSATRRRRAGGSAVLVGRGDGPQAFDPLYEQIYPATREGRSRVSRQQFGSYLADQVERIQQKTGCDQVRVEVVSEDGRRRLKVRAIHSATKNDFGSASDEA